MKNVKKLREEERSPKVKMPQRCCFYREAYLF